MLARLKALIAGLFASPGSDCPCGWCGIEPEREDDEDASDWRAEYRRYPEFYDLIGLTESGHDAFHPDRPSVFERET